MIEEKWRQMNLYQQLGNVASEISRACYWEEKGDMAARNKAIERGLELLDLTLAGGRGQKEIARLRELISDKLVDGNFYQFDLKQAQDYLLPFALLARRQKKAFF